MKILNELVLPGETKTINLEIAKFHTATKLKVPIIVSRAKVDGPTVLLSSGLHGDELNGIDIVRQLIFQKINIPKKGTIICIPVINIFGFINKTREFPDGRDLNRVFPGSKTGSLASRFAYHIVNYILPFIDYVIDFHAGGQSRFNAAQLRVAPGNEELETLANIFQPPFLLYSNNISGSFRSACSKRGIKTLLFEGGKSMDIDKTISTLGIEGTMRFLKHFDMLHDHFQTKEPTDKMITITNSAWIRAKVSGLLIDQISVNTFVKKGATLASIADPYGKEVAVIKAPHEGYIINVNDAPIVYQGDAIFHISKKLKHD